MISSLAGNITSKLVQGNYIQKEQYDEYVYALILIMSIVVTDVTTILIGLVMGMFWECMGFCFTYKILRKYCGGYHFSTSLRCYLSTCVMCPAVLLIIRYSLYNVWVWSVLWMISAAVVFILSPVEAVNKPLDDKEQKVFGAVAKIIILVLCICYLFFVMMKFTVAVKALTLSMVSVALFAVIGKVQLKYLKR